jgi:hypothetical protein
VLEPPCTADVDWESHGDGRSTSGARIRSKLTTAWNSATDTGRPAVVANNAVRCIYRWCFCDVNSIARSTVKLYNSFLDIHCSCQTVCSLGMEGVRNLASCDDGLEMGTGGRNSGNRQRARCLCRIPAPTPRPEYPASNSLPPFRPCGCQIRR